MNRSVSPVNAVFENLLNNIPDYKEFLTLEELDASSKALAEKYPDVVSILRWAAPRMITPCCA